MSEVNYLVTYGEISGNGGCWNTARSDKESGAFVSSGRPELLSYEPRGDQRDSRKGDIYPNNTVYLKIQLVPLSTFLAMQNIKSPITKANEQVNQKSSLFWCSELKRADSLVSTDFAFTVKRNSLFA